jgi:hypothetical protein
MKHVRTLAFALIATFGVAQAHAQVTAEPHPFVVGDTWVFMSKEFNKVTYYRDVVSSVAADGVVMTRISTENRTPRQIAYTVDGNEAATADRSYPEIIKFPMKVGEWTGKWERKSRNETGQYTTKVVGQMMVNVPAGEFSAWKLERNGNSSRGGSSRQVYFWAPDAKARIQREHKDGREQFTEELVGYAVTVNGVVKSNFVDVPGCDFCQAPPNK